MSDSGESQDTESICSGKLSHVSLQPAVVPSPRSLSRDQSLRSHTWNLSGTQGNVFGNPRAVVDSLFESKCDRWKYHPVHKSTGSPVAKGEEQIGSTIPMPSLAKRTSTINSYFPAEVPQNSLADQQRLQISELHFDKFPTPSTFSCWKIRFKTQVSSCSGFSLGGYVMDERSGDGRFG